MPAINRRNFLKIGSALSGALAVSRLARGLSAPASQPSILIFVFDAMSAKNLSLYGYRRKTTPNLERFAQRATVFHQHYAAGNFTTPGTASLLTGLYPWTHRAINESGLIARKQAEHNLFHVLGREYYRLAFSQNIYPNYFFGQFKPDIEQVLSPAAFSFLGGIAADQFGRDLVDSHRAFDDFLFQDNTPPASLVFGLIERLQLHAAVSAARRHGLPVASTSNYPIFFDLKRVFDGILSTIERLPAPSAAYFHLWSPHAPYQPARRFRGLFRDGWAPEPKPYHSFSDSPLHYTEEIAKADRQAYDEYIANVDAEFGRVLDFLTATKRLDNTYVVVTSDHGEMFERGVEGHLTRLLFEPVIQVPLLISSPGQGSRRDVAVPTSAVDLLPTLAYATGRGLPTWCEGTLLPGFGGTPEPERSIFVVEAKHNSAFAPLSNASFALRKGRYKLTYYIGFRTRVRQQEGVFELYDIENDPEELSDLYPKAPAVFNDLKAELLAKVDAENARFKA